MDSLTAHSISYLFLCLFDLCCMDGIDAKRFALVVSDVLCKTFLPGCA